MKNVKIIFLSLISFVAFTNLSLSASSAPSNAAFIEILNKNNENILVTIVDANTKRKLTTIQVPAYKYERSGMVDMNSTLLIEVSSRLIPHQSFIINAPGKTKYLSWDAKKSTPLYPQSGNLMGKTNSGLPLKNNVKESQIFEYVE